VILLVACAAPGPFGRAEPAPDLEPPVIASFALSCDLDASQWTLEAEATSWTGGGTSFWTVDGEYVEEHVVDTVAYEPDGSGETLRAEIAIVSDWRLLAPRNTAFTCAEDPDVIFLLSDRDGGDADCRTSGPDPAVWADVEGVGVCVSSGP
jgi:hypothetical protein